MDLEEIWRIREEEIYPALFGGERRGIFPLTQELFSRRFGQIEIDPRWLFMGVFEFAPTAQRACWIYITSGYSNPWNDDPKEAGWSEHPLDGVSGAGVEFLLATTHQGDWAIRRLLDLFAFDILLANGRFPGRDSFAVGDRIPMKAPIDGSEHCLLRNMIVSAVPAWPGFSLPSGGVQFLVFTGISDAEISHAKVFGTDALVQVLEAHNYHPVTDPSRPSLF